MDALITKMNSDAMSMTSSTEMIETLNQSSSCTTEEPGLSDDSTSSPPTVAVIGKIASVDRVCVYKYFKLFFLYWAFFIAVLSRLPYPFFLWSRFISLRKRKK